MGFELPLAESNFLNLIAEIHFSPILNRKIQFVKRYFLKRLFFQPLEFFNGLVRMGDERYLPTPLLNLCDSPFRSFCEDGSRTKPCRPESEDGPRPIPERWGRATSPGSGGFCGQHAYVVLILYSNLHLVNIFFA